VGYRENLYDLVLVLHVLAVIVGFGAVALNGVYGVTAKDTGGTGGLAITKANFKASSIASILIYTVPITGIGLVGLSDGAIEFGETWVWLSFVLYVVGVGVSHAVLLPSAKRSMALQEELVAAGPGPGPGGPPPQAAELAALGRRMAMAGTFLNLLLVVIVSLMIFKPGGHVL
jgi:uncharacterized membrane protein